ncbi:tetratricopeptide repeat-containing glycosyltransferase family protein [Phenylobacterium aquaticum]|uniref:tetratricopeptide repeat-containing glycosyltransferase family protein n=1 Tax=Phenylobacterium aquaticum TaxID=1763816 RepID=UPI0026ECEE7D|nr:tetratricopeptide repeat-containing glycosyltransferase family protein [Phenylobacterium aquaticum]
MKPGSDRSSDGAIWRAPVFSAARRCYGAGMSLADSPEALFRRAVDLQIAGSAAEAESLYLAAVGAGLGPDLLPDAHGNLGVLYRATHRLAEAEVALKTAIRLRSDWAAPHYNLGNLYSYQRRLLDAEAAYLEALRIKPDHPKAPFNLGQIYLSQGRFAEGWPMYEARPDRTESPLMRVRVPEWTGQPLEGKSILVWREQGYGDEILMARYVPLLKAQGARQVKIAPTLAMLRLFESLGGVDEVVTLVGDVQMPDVDYWVLPCSLPASLGTDDTLKSQGAYLSVPEAARARWSGFGGPGFKVGFTWQGNPKQPNNFNRSMKGPELFNGLADLGVEMIDLQEPRGDFADTAAILEQLDLVITVDTAMAHLAGALDKPCWVVLAALGTCWRYPPPQQSVSPWYRSTTIYRQTTPGDWAEVFARVRRDLAARIAPDV